MARPTTVLLVFFLSFNLLAGIMTAQGIDTMLGIDSEVGGDERVDETVDQVEGDLETGTGGFDLFGMYNTLTRGLESVYEFVFAGPAMLNRAGVPGWITGLLATIMAVVAFFDVLAFIRGYSI